MANIMIVDDAMFVRKLLKDIFIKYGHQVVAEACDAKEAILLYQKHKPDLVTMDIIMPEKEGLNGIGAVKKIMKDYPNAKILMISAMGQQELVVEAIQAGAKDFIVKPFLETNVINILDRLLKS
jgi:two-component system chemotaxis response regulator CheY